MFDFNDTRGYDFERLKDLIGSGLFETLETASKENLADSLSGAHVILDTLAVRSERERVAKEVLKHLIPTRVDRDLWKNLAAGKNVHLPASDQYGSQKTRSQSDGKGQRMAKGGNAYGKVHSKGDQEPSAFLRRQGDFLAGRAKRVALAEAELRRAKEELDQAEHGMRVYAATLLLTELRNATAPIFSMGPAWTILRAINGEESSTDPVAERRDAQRILVVLHALRDDKTFLTDLKTALLKVCEAYRGIATQNGSTDFSAGDVDYEFKLENLDWPPPPPF